MSTFNGIIWEYPFISVDCFKGQNLSSSVYFLSHCHTDHMRGLSSQTFYDSLLERPDVKIYLSHVSKIFLENDDKYRHLSGHLESLPIETASVVSVKENSTDEDIFVSVTLLPSGHCPGSVMFLFEGYNGTVLYTGDFRIECNYIKRFKHLHYENGRLKQIDKMYLDATFCEEKSFSLPSRQDCLNELVFLVRQWISLGKDHVVYLICPANYGYEYAFISLHEILGSKVHISPKKFEKYKHIPEIIEAVTRDQHSTQIHSGCFYGVPPNDPVAEVFFSHGMTECGYRTDDGRPLLVRCIKLSAMFYAFNTKLKRISVYNYGKRLFNACYSTHSSLVEIWSMLSYLKPKALHFIAIPDSKTGEQVLKMLSPCLSEENSEGKSLSMPTLGTLKPCDTEKIHDDPDSFNSLNFDYPVQVSLSEFVGRSSKLYSGGSAEDHLVNHTSATACSSYSAAVLESRTVVDASAMNPSLILDENNRTIIEVNQVSISQKCDSGTLEGFAKSLEAELKNEDCVVLSECGESTETEELTDVSDSSSSELDLSFEEDCIPETNMSRNEKLFTQKDVSVEDRVCENIPVWESVPFSPIPSDATEESDGTDCKDSPENSVKITEFFNSLSEEDVVQSIETTKTGEIKSQVHNIVKNPTNNSDSSSSRDVHEPNIFLSAPHHSKSSTSSKSTQLNSLEHHVTSGTATQTSIFNSVNATYELEKSLGEFELGEVVHEKTFLPSEDAIKMGPESNITEEVESCASSLSLSQILFCDSPSALQAAKFTDDSNRNVPLSSSHHDREASFKSVFFSSNSSSLGLSTSNSDATPEIQEPTQLGSSGNDIHGDSVEAFAMDPVVPESLKRSASPSLLSGMEADMFSVDGFQDDLLAEGSSQVIDEGATESEPVENSPSLLDQSYNVSCSQSSNVSNSSDSDVVICDIVTAESKITFIDISSSPEEENIRNELRDELVPDRDGASSSSLMKRVRPQHAMMRSKKRCGSGFNC